MGQYLETNDRALRGHLTVQLTSEKVDDFHEKLLRWADNQQGVAIYYSNLNHQQTPNCIASNLELIAGVGIASELAMPASSAFPASSISSTFPNSSRPSTSSTSYTSYTLPTLPYTHSSPSKQTNPGQAEPHIEAIDKTNSFSQLQALHDQHQDWLFGHLSYDLKNELERLNSKNPDNIGFSRLRFFQPIYVFELRKGLLQLYYLKSHCTQQQANDLIDELIEPISSAASCPISTNFQAATQSPNIQSKVTKEQYVQNVTELLKQIEYGNTYELNYCIEFFSQMQLQNPVETYLKLNQSARAPFSAYYRQGNCYLLCSSPERFLLKQQGRVYSQPIKGTAPRAKDPAQDTFQKESLLHSLKEATENTMIVDLVRNDLSKNAQPNSLKVDELLGVYTFNRVHQLISTISASPLPNTPITQIIKDAFPMGSMTGVPKVKAMQLIDQFESTARGLYSGSVGYITPTGDFDFNVVIRSIQYNAQSQYLSMMVGSAITAQSDAEQEYQECLLKVSGLIEALELNQIAAV